MTRITASFVIASSIVGLLGVGLSGRSAQIGRGQARTLLVKQVLHDVGTPVRVRAKRGRFFLLSGSDNAVLRITDKFALERRIGRIGNAPGELYHPQDFDVSETGVVWVADTGNDRIQRLGADGSPEGSFKVQRPFAIASLPRDLVAVVGTHDDALVRVYSSEGIEQRAVTATTAVEGANVKQTHFLNRSRLAVTKAGELILTFRWLLPPVVRIEGAGQPARFLEISSAPVRMAIDRVRNDRVKDLKSGSLGGKTILNSAAVDEATGDIWIAPSTTVLIKFNSRGQQLAEYVLKNPAGEELGALDLAILNKTLLVISGPYCFTATLP